MNNTKEYLERRLQHHFTPEIRRLLLSRFENLEQLRQASESTLLQINGFDKKALLVLKADRGPYSLRLSISGPTDFDRLLGSAAAGKMRRLGYWEVDELHKAALAGHLDPKRYHNLGYGRGTYFKILDKFKIPRPTHHKCPQCGYAF